MAASKINVAECLRFASTRKGKSYFSQVVEMYKLKRALGTISADDYFTFRLYDDGLFSMPQKLNFISDSAHGIIIGGTCPQRWWAAADDKLLAYMILERAGAATPRVQAVYHPFRVFPGAATCKDQEALGRFLRRAGYPLFAKPVGGVQSGGALSVHGFDAATDSLDVFGAGPVAVDDFTRELGPPEGDGYIFQDRIRQHPEIEAACGQGVATVRLMVLIDGPEPEIIEGLWKIPAKDSVADNFWRPGNMMGGLDMASGAISHVVRGTGPDQEEIEIHPDTGARLKGLVLPHWQAIKAACLQYAAVYSGIPFQSWDIAIGPDGPIVVEVNVGAAYSLPQIVYGRGFLTPRFRAFLEAHRSK